MANDYRQNYLNPYAPYTIGAGGVVQARARDLPGMNEASYNHPIFGIQKVAVGTNSVRYTEEDARDMYTDMAMRASGLAQKISRNNNILLGLANPKEYLRSKNEALSQLSATLGSDYRRVMDTFLDHGIPTDQAKSITDDYIKKLAALKEMTVELAFPTEIAKEAKEALMKGNH